MKRIILIIFGCLLGLSTIQSQSVLSYRYWYDQDVSNIRSGLLGDGSLMLDANGLEDGLHTLNIVLEGDALIAPQRYMFLKVSPHAPNPMAGLSYRYWYDQDVSNIRSELLGDGSLVLDANGLEDGLHTLNIVLEGD
ncbi:MAG: hypothetical protein MJZ20_14575, partial [Bacteroidaceae bacterium]|nr:hypothetical protein [Bacteroidaceae bacterium]